MYVTLWASPFQMNWRAQVQYPWSGAGEVPPLLVPLKISGSSGCLGRKLVIAQDAAQSLADLRTQRLCPSANRRDRRTLNQSVKRQKRPASTLGWYSDTHWLGRPPPHSLGSLVASLLRASPGALPWVTRTEKKKEGEWREHRSISNSCHVGVLARAYLDFFRFWNWEGLDKIFDLFSLYHEVVHELLLVCCSIRVE